MNIYWELQLYDEAAEDWQGADEGFSSEAELYHTYGAPFFLNDRYGANNWRLKQTIEYIYTPVGVDLQIRAIG